MVQDCVFTCTDMRILDSGRQPAVLERWLPFVNIQGKKGYGPIERLKKSLFVCPKSPKGKREGRYKRGRGK